MKNLIGSFLILFILVLLSSGCKKETTTPVAPASLVSPDDTRNIVQTQDAIAQLFSVTAYSQAIAQMQMQGIPTPCGVAKDIGVSGGQGIEITFDNCSLATGLVVDGTLRFETFESPNPPTPAIPLSPSNSGGVKTHLIFSTFTINGCTITNLSAGSFIVFRDVADNNAGYDLFQVYAPQTFRVDHTLDDGYTIFVPFNSTGIPEESVAHLKVRTDPSLNVTFAGNSPTEFLDELYNVELTLKIENRPVTDPPGLPFSNRWRALTYTSSGEKVQNLQLRTGSTSSDPSNEDIEGLKMSLQCGHFKGGTLILDKEIRTDFNNDGIIDDTGCFYPYQIFDFDYDMQSGDQHLDVIDCNYSLPTEDAESCDGWAIRTNYGDCSSTICSVCNQLNQRPDPVCQKVQCW